MTEHGWVDIAALVVGGVSAVMVLWTGRQRGIGPQIRLTLALCLISPVILILGLEKVINSEAIAAIVGALIGAGVPAATGGGSATGGGGEAPRKPGA